MLPLTVRWGEDKIPQTRLKIVKENFTNAVNLTPDNPRALFYQVYWSDFQQRVIEPKSS
ncbi:MAG: hypothetical protein AAGE84_16290 [Cyanobacteria bacterium P01_G01_bin.39]